MIIGIDHILIAVENLDEAIETYRRLGFQVSQGGEHPDRGTYNALVPLADGAYFELIGVKDRALVQEKWQLMVETLARENRLMTFALDSDAIEADIAAIRARGVPIGDPAPGERIRPDGQRVAWRKADFENSALPFLIQDVTPREVRIPLPSEGIERSLGIAAAIVGSHDVDARRADYEKIIGMSLPFDLTRGSIQIEELEAGDEFLRVALVADNIGALAEQWRAQGVSFRESVVEGIGLILEPLETEGVPLQITGQVSEA